MTYAPLSTRRPAAPEPVPASAAKNWRRVSEQLEAEICGLCTTLGILPHARLIQLLAEMAELRGADRPDNSELRK